jgi:hypothetical protein
LEIEHAKRLKSSLWKIFPGHTPSDNQNCLVLKVNYMP